MSASGPTLGEPSAGSRRPSRWRRLLRLALALSLAGLGSLVLVFVFLHTPAGHGFAKRLLETSLGPALGVELRLGSLRYRLWAGSVEVTGLRISWPDGVLEIAETEARWSPRGGLALRLARPVVVARDDNAPGPTTQAIGLAARPWTVLERIARVEVTTGRVELQGRTGAPYLVLDPVDAALQERRGRREIRITLHRGVVPSSAGRASLAPFSGTADLHLAGDSLVIDTLRLETKGSSADLRGRLDRLRPNEGTASLRIDADSALASLFAADAELSGRVLVQSELDLKGSLRGRLQASSPALVAQGVGPWAASLRGSFDSGRLLVEEAEARGYGGRLTLGGPISLDGRSTTDLVLSVEGMDAATFGRAATGSELPIRSRLDARLRWTTTGLDLERARGQGGASLQPRAAPAAAGMSAAPGLPLAGTTRLVVEGRRVGLQALRLEARGLVVAGDLAISPALDLQGFYRAELPLESLQALAADLGTGARPPALVGKLVAEGEVSGRAQAPLATLRLRGEGISTTEAAGVGTVTLAGDGEAAGGRLTFGSLVVTSSGGGQAVLAGGVPLTAAGGEWDLRGEIRALDLAPLLAAGGIDGRGPLDGGVSVAGPHGQPTLRADVRARITPAGTSEPLVVSLSGSSAGTRLAVERLEASLAGGRLRAEGSFDSQSHALAASATAEGLRLARLPWLPESLRGLDGTLAADLTLAGSMDAPAGQLSSSLTQASFGESPLPGLTLTARADGQRLEVVGASLDHERPAVASPFLRGGGPLRGDWPLHLELDVAALPLQAVLDALPAARQHSTAMAAHGIATIDLPLRKPGNLRYASGGLDATGRLRDVEWRTERFRIEGGVKDVTVAGLRVTATSSSPASPARDRERTAEGDRPPAPLGATAPEARAGGTLAVDGRVPIAREGSFDLALEGALDLAALQGFAATRVAGDARIRFHILGTAAEPQVEGEAAVSDGRGRLGAVRVSGVQLLAQLQGAEARIERLEAGILGGRVTATGALPLRRLAPGVAAARLHLEATDLDLSRLAVSGSQRGPETPTFLVSVDGDFEASAPRLELASGHGRLTRVEEQSPEGRIALQAPAEWTLARGQLTLAPLRLAGPLGTLEARAEARVAGGPPRGSATVAGPFDLRLIGPFLADTTLAGPATIDLRASWDAKGVRLDGGLTVEAGRLTLEDLAFSLTQIKGEVRLLGDRATVDATAVSGDGRLALSGGMSFGPGLLGPARLQLEAQRIPINYPEGFRGRAAGRVQIAGEPGAYGIEGTVNLTQAYYTADFDQKSRSLDRLQSQLQALQGTRSVGESLALSLRVRFGEPLRIRNARAQLDVIGSFTAQGTLAEPSATGQVSLVEGGVIRVRRADVRVQQGRVELNGFPAGNPELDVTGTSTVAGTEMDVHARGTFEDLDLEITSANRPDLSQTDLVSLLLAGRTAQNAAAQSTTIVAEELAAALGGVFQRGIGELLLVDVGPDSSLLMDDVDPTQRFNLGARLRQDLIVLYSTRLDGTEQRWIVEWNPRGGRLRLRAIDDQNPGVALEISDRWSFDVFKRRRRAIGQAPRELARLRALRIEGALPLPADELMKATRLKVGRGYSALRFEQAADAMRARFADAGFWGASVDTVSTPAVDDPRAVELTFRVDAGPRVRATWTGDVPGPKLRGQALAAWPAYASPESAAGVVARTVQILLQADRYYGAKVEHEVRAREGETELVLHVLRGPRGKGVTLDFEGNTTLDDEALRAVLPKPGSREFFESLAGRRSRLNVPLRVAYARVGHLRTRARRPRSEYDAASGRLHVVVPIVERGAAHVARISLPQEIVEAGDEAPALSLREGSPFDLDAYIADRDAVTAWYREAGWMEARVRGLLEPSGEALHVSFEATPGARLRAGRIRVRSGGRAAPAMVRRAVVVEPGAIIRPRELAESRARLSELGVFRSVDVRPASLRGGERGRGSVATPPAEVEAARGDNGHGAAAQATTPGENVRDVVVSYVERPDVTLEYGLRYNTSGSAGVGGSLSSPGDGRLQVASSLQLANPIGWGWRLRPYALLTTDRHTFGVAAESATLFGLRVRTQLLVLDDNDNRDRSSALASQIRGVSVQQTRALLESGSGERSRDRLRVQWGFAKKWIRYLDPSGAETGLAGERGYLSLSLAGDERDSLTDPRRGLFWSASSELARRELGSDVNYVRLYGQLFAYLPLPGRLVWAQGYRAGIVPGEDPLLLLENRFQAGGSTTVRGYDQNDLGPQTGDGIGLGGQGVVILNQELRFPIWRVFSGGVFWDAGNVWDRAGAIGVGDLRQSVGVGLRVMFPFGPVRVEYAWNVGRNRDGRRGHLVFGLGHAF